jgi:plasmid stabilization system protein ParE
LKPVNIQARAEAEADEAAAWYEAEQPGLGGEFLLELDAAIERAAETPLAYAQVFMDARRVLMRRFPFAVYFVYEHEIVESLQSFINGVPARCGVRECVGSA